MNFCTYHMEKDELLKRVLMIQRLHGMETEPVSAEDPYASMEKDQLISMIHFLVKREDEKGAGKPGTEGYGEGTERYS